MKLKFLLFAFLLSTSIGCKFNASLERVSYENDNKLSDVEPSEDIDDMIEPYRESLENEMNEVIAVLAQDMSKGKPESLLGNVLADATKVMAQKYSNLNVDIGVVNYGGIRLPQINKGELTLGTVYELMPFDNFLVILEMRGSELQAFCDAVAARGGWPISGVTFEIENEKAVNVDVGGEGLMQDVTYNMAISDYVANGGDKMEMLKQIKQYYTGKFLRNAFIDYFIMLDAEGEVEAKIEGRIK